MKRWIVLATLVLSACVIQAASQTTDCPSDKVCISQATADKLFNAVNELLTTKTQLVDAKDVIGKMLTERGSSDAEIAKLLKLVEEWKEVDVVNGMIHVKYERVIALYERTMDLYQKVLDNAFVIIEKQDKQLHGDKSAWAKFLSGVKRVVDLAAGIALGRILK